MPAVVASTCPYLVAADGRWRRATAARDHRCGAIDPLGTVGLDRQRRFCLSAGHNECSTYRASEELRGASARARSTAEADARRPLVQTIPVLLDRTAAGGFAAITADRRAAQLVLVLLMTLALGTLVYARGLGPAGVARGSGSQPSASVAIAMAATPGPSTLQLFPSPSSSPVPATPPARVTSSPRPATPSRPPSPTPRTYTIRPGDTLTSIAARFATTAAELRSRNNIGDPRSLRIGRVLILP